VGGIADRLQSVHENGLFEALGSNLIDNEDEAVWLDHTPEFREEGNRPRHVMERLSGRSQIDRLGA
jgi:hypothetical protein